jgi:hypothetical protein
MWGDGINVSNGMNGDDTLKNFGGNDTLRGESGWFNGGVGRDTMIGGLGNDTYMSTTVTYEVEPLARASMSLARPTSPFRRDRVAGDHRPEWHGAAELCGAPRQPDYRQQWR